MPEYTIKSDEIMVVFKSLGKKHYENPFFAYTDFLKLIGKMCKKKEENMNKKISVVWIVFFLYVIGYFAICIIFENQNLLWLELSFLSLVVSVYLVVKNHFPARNYIVISLVLTLLYLISNIFRFKIFTVVQAIILFFASCASWSVFEKYKENSLSFIRNTKKTDIFVSILLGFIVGVVFGGINYLLMQGSNPMDGTNVIKALMVSLNPAILEEVAFRCVLFAFCLYMADGELTGKFQKFTGWCMMIVPHILPHMLFHVTNGIIESVISWLVSLVLYIAVFGFIFALLQKKRDVASAMIAHGTVDWIRFCIFGLPY